LTDARSGAAPRSAQPLALLVDLAADRRDRATLSVADDVRAAALEHRAHVVAQLACLRAGERIERDLDARPARPVGRRLGPVGVGVGDRGHSRRRPAAADRHSELAPRRATRGSRARRRRRRAR
jgi:hypothetical protein